jgi:hypothetical protein
MSKRVPFEGITPGAIQNLVCNGERPNIAPHWNEKIQQVIQTSWSNRAAERLSVKDARSILETIKFDDFTQSSSMSLSKFIGAPKVLLLNS